MGDYPKLSFRCPMKWEDMTGDEKRRFCERCQKQVTNLSALTRAERRAFLKSPRRDSACVSYLEEPPSPRLPLMGAFAAGLALLAGCAKQPTGRLAGPPGRPSGKAVGMVAMPQEGTPEAPVAPPPAIPPRVTGGRFIVSRAPFATAGSPLFAREPLPEARIQVPPLPKPEVSGSQIVLGLPALKQAPPPSSP